MGDDLGFKNSKKQKKVRRSKYIRVKTKCIKKNTKFQHDQFIYYCDSINRSKRMSKQLTHI